ncbi:tyrosine-type recombinase/integrase [Litorivivens sp.]|uniref:tyrosine-type recombinase/integrase n=2 Tax=Litorivivens sp. TaxID=2020868 RepID=UPI0035637D50
MNRYKWNKKTFFSIVDEHSCPFDPYVSAYLNTLSSYANSTQHRYGSDLLFILKYFDRKGIDLTDRLASGELLSMAEYSDFHTYCALSSYADLDLKVAPIFSHTESKTFRNIIASNIFVSSKVSSETQRGRLNRLRSYLTWLFEQFHDPFSVGERLDRNFQKLTMKIRQDERSLSGNKGHLNRHPTDDAIPPDVFCKLLEIIRPSSTNNPFTQRNRFRNYLIVTLLLDTGIRRGALAKLKISDLRFDRFGAALWIYADRDDVSDPRLERPNQKTKAHLAAVKPQVMEAVLFYIDRDRKLILGSEENDFVFVSNSNAKGTIGQPLAAKSINEVFFRLSKVLGYRVYPHLMRHMWNDLFDDNSDHQNFTSQQVEDARKYAMGWSANSTMTEIYNNRRIHQKVSKIMQKHQDRVDGSK